MPETVSRFSAVASQYDAIRPQPPADLVAVIVQWADVASPDVVDLGAGTGLSSVAWAGRARQVTAVEPSAGMRQLAERRIATAGAGSGTRFSVVGASAEDTGLPDASADVVTASQAMHWFDPALALPEIARLLRPGGVLAAYDCDWPPCIDPETGAAWDAVVARVDGLQARRGVLSLHGGKDHADRIRRSGLFRHYAEIAVHGRDQGDAERLVGLAVSAISHVADFLADGATEDELGITTLRDVAARRLAEPMTWWWTYRLRLAVM